MSTSPLTTQLHAAAEAHIRKLQQYLSAMIDGNARRIAVAEQLAHELSYRNIQAVAYASLDADTSVFIGVKAQGATVPDIVEALMDADIRTTGVYPGCRDTEIRTDLHHDLCIYIAHTDIPAAPL